TGWPARSSSSTEFSGPRAAPCSGGVQPALPLCPVCTPSAGQAGFFALAAFGEKAKNCPGKSVNPSLRGRGRWVYYYSSVLGYNTPDSEARRNTMALHVLDEANRCLGCKNPMCQQGCPIHTNIPEAIRLLKAGEMDKAGR